ncbi:solute carrier family 35 member E1 homolog isoform X3 [Penaeus japonicus]|uniref:solute carrier family 35 member E1 homolog isoform X3 n=1 Tax=Penaeus japonicus TaxID=27405 RepID=UPI001C7167E7|nr:solute carrier family 35 member E1 homolog isoform X3 [Penaeus japonicus]XP_042890947.1 solute carrier family 35 member E1 homolog isoform X3 [Penaeus japonicus]
MKSKPQRLKLCGKPQCTSPAWLNSNWWTADKLEDSRETSNEKVYFSLVPIILGVAIATITEISFDMLGLVSALVATCGFSLQNIFSKKVLTDTGIHHLRLLHLLGWLALIMFLPVWILSDGYSIFKDETWLKRRDPMETVILLLVDGALNWLQNLIAFTILNYVTPLTYAVANATKRISIITISLLLLRNPVTLANVVGMFLAIIGVLGYNKAKYDANMAKKKAAVVPLSQVTTNKLLHGYPSNSYNGSPAVYQADGDPLQLPPFHPAYVFNHANSARLGPYPRVQDGNTRISQNSGIGDGSENGYIHNGTNGFISNGHAGHTTRSYGRIDSV